MNLKEHYLEKLAAHGPVVAKNMFGGVGFFLHGVIFAIIVEKELYFRVDDETRGDFEKQEAKQFTYEIRDRVVGMPYFVVPDSVLNDTNVLGKWMEKAHMAALRNLKKKPKRKTRAAK